MRTAHLDWLTRFEIWSITHDLDLKLDLASYYALCCTFGLCTGLGIGSQMLRLL